MKIERRKNATRNIVSGFALRLFQTILPFLLRTVMIYTIGMEYVGLDTLFVSILHVLNLAELGVGNAMVYSMYDPIANDDKRKLNALLNLYKRYYNIIGCFILIVGLLIVPFLPNLISGNVPDSVNIYVLYFINLLSTVLSYWMFAYKTSILTSHQRTDVINKINIVAFCVRYGFQFIALLFLKNFYVYALGILVGQFAVNVFAYIAINRMYPAYQPEGKLEKNEEQEINQHIKDLFTAKLGGTVTNSADTVIISAFLGLTVLAKYNNYYYILSALFGFVSIIFQSCLAGIGNSLTVDTSKKNYEDFEKFSFLLTWVIGFCTVALYCLLQPFMKIWVHDENMLENSFLALFCIYFYVYELALVWSTYKDAGGIWHKDRFRPLCVTIVNLGLNLLTVQFWGLYGVVLSTIISYVFVGMPWMLHNIFAELFHRRAYKYILKLLYETVIVIVACFITGLLCDSINVMGVWGLVIKGIVALVVPNVIFLVFFFRTKEFLEVKKILIGVKQSLFKKK